jgi:hypothetical protein
MGNMIEAIQQKCSYIRETVIPAYERIGAVGRIGVMLLNNDVTEGEAAIASGDAVRMVTALRGLTDTCERAL